MSTSLNSDFRPLPRLLVWTGYAGAVLIIVGLVLYVPRVAAAPFLFAAGSLMFAVVQCMSSYEGTDVNVRRLRRQQVLGAVLIVAAAALMIAGICGWHYARHNEWILVLTVGAVFWVYSTLRISKLF